MPEDWLGYNWEKEEYDRGYVDGTNADFGDHVVKPFVDVLSGASKHYQTGWEDGASKSESEPRRLRESSHDG